MKAIRVPQLESVNHRWSGNTVSMMARRSALLTAARFSAPTSRDDGGDEDRTDASEAEKTSPSVRSGTNAWRELIFPG